MFYSKGNGKLLEGVFHFFLNVRVFNPEKYLVMPKQK